MSQCRKMWKIFKYLDEEKKFPQICSNVSYEKKMSARQAVMIIEKKTLCDQD